MYKPRPLVLTAGEAHWVDDLVHLLQRHAYTEITRIKVYCGNKGKSPYTTIVSMIVYGDGPSGEARYILIPDGNENQGVAAVEPAASNCPPDSCIKMFESRLQKKNAGMA